LLVVISILGVLAAVAVPVAGKFIGNGKTEAAQTEYSNVQKAITAAMTDAFTNNATGTDGAGPWTFGNTTEAKSKPYGGTDLTVATGYTVGAYIAGGAASLAGRYSYTAAGALTQLTFNGVAVP